MENTVNIIFKNESSADREQAVSAKPGDSILDAAKKAGIALDAPCGGNGSCGKCRVKIINGNVSSVQSRHISPEEYKNGWRLACAGYAETDVTVLIPETAAAWKNKIKIDNKSSHKLPVFENIDSGIKLIKITPEVPSVENPTADRERLLGKISELTGIGEPDITLYALRKIPGILRNGDFSVYCVLRCIELPDQTNSCTVIDVFPAGNNPAPVIAGLAVDIGTTTVSALLVDLADGKILASGTVGNGQIRYGADVISRIIESVLPSKNGEPGGLERLRNAVTGESLVPLIAWLCEMAELDSNQIYRTAVAANTTMTHLFLGIDPAYLRLEPYTPAFFECKSLCCAGTGLPTHPDAETPIAPAIGSYVGGDITAGVYSSMAFKTQEISLLIDLGTNGELVLGSDEFLMGCACSAGPAFEGGDISCGMRATDGAIEACTIDRETMEPKLSVIGAAGQIPLGICGSGLIDLIGELFRCGIINARGKFIREGKRIRRDEWGGCSFIAAYNNDASGGGREIAVNETDIDNFIRAKGAIFSAIQTMLKMLEFDISVIGNVYVAGGIGSGINIPQAVRIGMLPAIPVEKYHYIGNSSLHGAYAMLVSREAAAEIAKIGRDMTYIELSSHPGYMDELVAACFLPHTNGALFENY